MDNFVKQIPEKSVWIALHWELTTFFCFILYEGVRMHTVNGRKCEVKKALPRDDQALVSSGRSSTSELCWVIVVGDNLSYREYHSAPSQFLPGGGSA